MHTVTCDSGVRFHFNPDLSGEVRVTFANGTAGVLPGEDIRALIDAVDGEEVARTVCDKCLRDHLIRHLVLTIQGFMSADADLIVDNAMRIADALLAEYDVTPLPPDEDDTG